MTLVLPERMNTNTWMALYVYVSVLYVCLYMCIDVHMCLQVCV
jgi:hypothetical protein